MTEEHLRTQKIKLLKALETCEDSKSVKRKIHFNSLINITNVLIDFTNKKRPQELREQISGYYDLIFEKQLIFDKYESLENYVKYIHPSCMYMIHNYRFISSTVFYNYLIFGVILDIVFIGFFKFNTLGYKIPIFTLVSFIIGFYKITVAKRKGKYIAGNY